ncbi:MAG TPA: hypothetical protein VIM02_09795 [Rhizomicrobium sp.]|jgi:hypothetical protein
MHDSCSQNWYVLRPDGQGNYANGGWSIWLSGMPNGYAPLYFASALDAFGNLFVFGGEYNQQGASCPQAETKAGMIVFAQPDGTFVGANAANAPDGWSVVGDAASIMLPNATYMLAQEGSTNEAITPLSNPLQWSATGTGKADQNSEEGWTLLQSGNLLTVDTFRGTGGNTPAELYCYIVGPFCSTTGTWVSAGIAPSILVDPIAHEIGPAVLLPNGKVFQVGANSCGMAGCAAYTSIYDPGSNNWASGPNFPQVHGNYFDSADGPAALLPDGNVLVQASPSYSCLDQNGQPTAYCPPSDFFEFDGSNLVLVRSPRNGADIASYEGRMLELPTGQILWSSDIGDVEIYTPKGKPNKAWKPVIGNAPSSIFRNSCCYTASGKRFLGFSQGASYGDDAQMATNYPLIRITNLSDGSVCYAFTFGWGAVQTSTSTQFWIPQGANCEAGASQLVVIANGISSAPWSVQVQ